MRFHFTKAFKKQYGKLPIKIQDKIQERFTEFLQNEFDPTLNNHKLSGEFAVFRSINITGDYRAVYQKINGELVVWSAVGRHNQLYD